MKFQSYPSLFLILTLSLLSAFIYAEEKKTLSAGGYKVIGAAQEYLQQNKVKEAIQILRSALPKLKNKPYDTAVALQTLGYAFYELEDRKNARVAFIKAVELNTLPIEINQQLEYNILQIYTFDEDYKQAEAYLEKWLAKKPELSKDSNMLAATIYYNLNKYNKMIPFVQNAIKQSKSFDKTLYQLLAAAYIETKAYSKAAAVYEKIVARLPDEKQHWLQLVSIYHSANQYNKALSVSELAYKKGVFKDEAQIRNLSNFYLYNNIPLKAAELLEKEMKLGNISRTQENIELLANSWILAQEEKKAIDVLDEFLSQNSNADLQFRLGQLYYEVNDWKNAITTLQSFKEVNTGHKDFPKALMLLGISAYEMDDFRLSKNAFSLAVRHKESRSDAQKWLKQLETVKADS